MRRLDTDGVQAQATLRALTHIAAAVPVTRLIRVAAEACNIPVGEFFEICEELERKGTPFLAGDDMLSVLEVIFDGPLPRPDPKDA